MRATIRPLIPGVNLPLNMLSYSLLLKLRLLQLPDPPILDSHMRRQLLN